MDKSIFKYSDYREFLRDFYNHSKETNPNFSYRYFARKADLSSPNYLHMVINGERNLTKNITPKFSKAIGLNRKEQQYLDALVSFTHSKNNEAKRYYLELLQNLRKDKTGTLLTEEQYEYISNWYYPVIRELVSLPYFKESPQWIKKMLMCKVKIRQVKEALETLIRLGLITRDEKGRLIQTDTHVVTEEEVNHTAIYKFHQQMLSLAKEVLAKGNGNDDLEISGVTMAVSKKQFYEVRRRIVEFEDSILRYLTDNPDVPESVFQMNIQLFKTVNGNNG